MTQAEEIARFLSEALDLPLEETVFYGYLPERPLQAICVTKDQKDIRILLRANANALWPLAMAESIEDILQNAVGRQLTSGGRRVLRVETVQAFARKDGLYSGIFHLSYMEGSA